MHARGGAKEAEETTGGKVMGSAWSILSLQRQESQILLQYFQHRRQNPGPVEKELQYGVDYASFESQLPRTTYGHSQ